MGFSKVKEAAADFVVTTRNPNQFIILMMFFLHALIPIRPILSLYACMYQVTLLIMPTYVFH